MQKEQKGQVTVALVTIIEEEFDAVCRIFKLKQRHPGGLFKVRKVTPTGVYDILATRSDDWGNTPAGETVADIIEDFSPRYIVLIGIAGGVRRGNKRDGVRLGDVVIPNYIEYSELKKLSERKISRRSFAIDHPSYYLRRSVAEPIKKDLPKLWAKRIAKKRPGSGTPKAHIGNLVAGETLLGDPKADYQKQVLKHYYRALAVDMESMGIGREVYHQRRSPYYNPQYLVVRGISDYVYVDESGEILAQKKKKKKAPADNQSTRDKWRVYAAESAAAFASVMVESLLREFGKDYGVRKGKT